jgi:hypothetical protein
MLKYLFDYAESHGSPTQRANIFELYAVHTQEYDIIFYCLLFVAFLDPCCIFFLRQKQVDLMFSVAEMVEGSNVSHAQAYVAINPDAAKWSKAELGKKMSTVRSRLHALQHLC